MQRVIGRFGMGASWTCCVYILVLALAFSSAPWANAEDATSNGDLETPPAPVVVENPTVVPTSAPPAPEPPVAPEPDQTPVEPKPELPPTETVPTEPVPSEIPTEVAPGEGAETPSPEPSAEPMPDVTEMPGDVETNPNPDANSTPTTEPTIAPTAAPTQEPTPVITWSQTAPVTCELRDDHAAGLTYAESRTYHCDVAANVGSDIAMPADMQIEWTLDVHFPDAYQLQFPEGSQASITEQISGATANATTYSIANPWKQGSEQKLEFELVVTRNTCAIGEQVLTIQAAPELRTAGSEAEITRADGNIHPDPAQLASPVIDAEAPTVAFDGAISFSPIGATSVGLQTNVTTGSATIVVTGDWDPCTTWTVDMSGAVDVPAETPAQLRAVSLNEEPITGEACDLVETCDVIVLPATGDAATPLHYTVGLELQLHELTPVGSFGIDLHTEVHGEVNQP